MWLLLSLLMGLPDRSQPPVVGEPTWPQIPVAKIISTADGLPVWFYQDNRLPLVTVAVGKNRGKLHVTHGQHLHHAVRLMRYGPRKKKWWSQKLAKLSAQMSIGVGFGSGWFEVETLQQNADRGLALLTSVIRRPNFAHWRTEKASQTKQLLRRQNTLSVVHRFALRKILFGEAHPYAYIADAGSLHDIKKSDLKRSYRQYMSTGIAGAVVVGSLSERQARLLVEQHLEPLFVAPSPSIPTEYPPVPKWQPRTIIVDFPTAGQVGITVLVKGLKSADRQVNALRHATAVLGGGFSSRLSNNLRETQGVTYAIGASSYAYRDVGYIDISCTVGIEDVPLAISEILREVNKMSTVVPTAQEFVAAKLQQRTAIVSDVSTGTSIARKLLSYQTSGAGVLAWKTSVSRVKDISLEAVQSVSKRVFSSPSVIILVTGDAERLTDLIDSDEVLLSTQIVGNNEQN